MGFKRNFTSDFFKSKKNEFFKIKFSSDFCLKKTMGFWKNILDLIFVYGRQ